MSRTARLHGLLLVVLLSFLILSASTVIGNNSNKRSTFLSLKEQEITPEDDLIYFGGRVNVEVSLEDTSYGIIDKSNLTFTTELIYPEWHIIMEDNDGNLNSEGGLSKKLELALNHTTLDTMYITLSGKAPFKKKDYATFMYIEQSVENETFEVLELKRIVTTQKIEETLNNIQRVENHINSTHQKIDTNKEMGAETNESEDYLQTAREFLDNAKSLYTRNDYDKSMEATNTSYNYSISADGAAEAAAQKYHDAEKAREQMARMLKVVYGIIAVLMLLIIIIIYRRRRWDSIGGF